MNTIKHLALLALFGVVVFTFVVIPAIWHWAWHRKGYGN